MSAEPDARPSPRSRSPPSRCRRAASSCAVVLANLGIMLAFYTPIQNLLPRLAEQVSPDSKEAGARRGSPASARSCRSSPTPLPARCRTARTSRFGRRKPWVLVRLAARRARDPARSRSSRPCSGSPSSGASARPPSTRRTPASRRPSPTRSRCAQRGLVSGWVGSRRPSASCSASRSCRSSSPASTAGIVVTAVLLVLLVLPFVLPAARPAAARRTSSRRSARRRSSRGFWVSPRQLPRLRVGVDHALPRDARQRARHALPAVLAQGRGEGRATPEQAQTLLILALRARHDRHGGRARAASATATARRKIYVIVATLVMAGVAVHPRVLPDVHRRHASRR